jgi:hypothetical protein
VATAASGDSNSPSVHYWRIIRDTMLSNSTFSPFVDWYYRNGPSLAGWLENNAWLKPAVNFALETSGEAIVRGRYLYLEAVHTLQRFSVSFWGGVEKTFVSTAHAEETPDPFLNPATGYFNFHVAQVHMTTDKSTWDAYFQSKGKAKPLYAYSGAIGYALWSASFVEFNVAGQGTYFGAVGTVPSTLSNGTAVDSRVAGTEHVATVLMLSAGLDARIRVPHRYASWIAPRVSYFEGYARARMEPRMQGTRVSEPGSEWPVGYTFMKRMSMLRVSGEFMFGRLFHQDLMESRSSVGIGDMGFSVFYETWTDRSNSLSLSSNLYGGGLTFLFQ